MTEQDGAPKKETKIIIAIDHESKRKIAEIKSLLYKIESQKAEDTIIKITHQRVISLALDALIQKINNGNNTTH